jgi:Carbohydrate binding module (family 6)
MTVPLRRTAAAGLVALLVTGLIAGAGSSPATAAAVVYEAELATIVNGTVSTAHPGFTGTGFVDTANVVGAAVEFTVNQAAAATETLVFRYANGSTGNRTAALVVNGVTTATLPFPPTGSWSTWSTQNATGPLAVGANTVRLTATTAGGLANIDSLTVGGGSTNPPQDVLPSLAPNLVAFYDFEHPSTSNAAVELDQGPSRTSINLVNGGAAMRVRDGAHPRSTNSLQLKQVRPTVASNDDWKAGRYSGSGVTSLNAFSHVQGITIMGWFKMTGQNPSPNSNTSSTTDFYGGVGFAGILSGDSNGHPARALIELFKVNGQMRLSVLGRRIDPNPWQVFAANEDWHTILPQNTWVFLTATLNYNTGTMALYKNGQPLPGFYGPGDPWGIGGGGGPFFTSATNPRGIKIGGSFPQNNRETNPCNCRTDSLMFFNRDATPTEVAQQYTLATTP